MKKKDLSSGEDSTLGPNTFFGYGTRVDDNGLPTGGAASNGPTWRAKDEGVGDPGYFGGAPRPPKSMTLPAASGIVKPNGDPKSLLEELDEE